MVGSSGLEPPTLRLSGARSNHLSYEPIPLNACRLRVFLAGGDEEVRTPDPLRARQVLSQLSYTPGIERTLSLQNRTASNGQALADQSTKLLSNLRSP